MACPQKFIPSAIKYDGINLDPSPSDVEITFGGAVASEGKTTAGNTHHAEWKMAAGKIKASITMPSQDLRGRCGTLIVVTTEGKSYTMNDASVSTDYSLKGGSSMLEIEWVGSPVTVL